VFGLLESGLQHFFWGNAVMLAIGGLLIYLAISKKMEPLLLFTPSTWSLLWLGLW